MFSTPRVSVIEAPNLPPRLRLHWKKQSNTVELDFIRHQVLFAVQHENMNVICEDRTFKLTSC